MAEPISPQPANAPPKPQNSAVRRKCFLAGSAAGGVSVLSRDVYGNETGSQLLCAAVLPRWACEVPQSRPDALTDQMAPLHPRLMELEP